MSASSANLTRLGAHGPQSVSRIGLGCMGMSMMYGASDDAQSTATIHAALDAGVNLLDTGGFYGMGHNEMLVGHALQGRRDQALLSVKFGAMCAPDGTWTGVDGRPAAVKNFLSYSLQRLGTKHIDIYRLARLDPAVPIEDTIGAIAEMIKAGYVRYIGLSEVGVETIARAHKVHPITDLQIEYSLISRRPEVEILPRLKALGIGVSVYGVLSRGLLAGSGPTGPSDLRARLPRFHAQNLAQNQQLHVALQQLASGLGASAAQIAIALVAAKGRALALDMVTLVSARTLRQLEKSLGALPMSLTEQEMERIEQAIPADAAAGTRYDPVQMAHLDSEK